MMANSNNIFNMQRRPRVERNVMDLSHPHTTTFEMGRIYPTCLIETLPGDRFTMNSTKMLRFSPLVSPCMTRIRVIETYFYCPNRILFKEWKDFITGKDEAALPTLRWFDPAASPNIPIQKTIGSYMGLPLIIGANESPSLTYQVSALPLAAYTFIYNEFYRDQNLQPEIPNELIQASNDSNPAFSMRYHFQPFIKAWEKDYFTSALPFAQKGAPVLIPLTTKEYATMEFNNGISYIRNAATGALYSGSPLNSALGDAGLAIAGSVRLGLDVSENMRMDLNSQAATIESLRTALKLQVFLEGDIQGGTRYPENIQ